ncbi:type I secretion system permease/ATPase [Aliidiomarina quisquiliarum]|uniref:type I secretion system permease/ATPase n=1 Tax=Aliidiomarina quisquiliarum TaxID=2938947 RepID=UPI00208FEFA9|nr:type I secretion system permease/ATPase [Aliidiomarina quisquiliarum]
MSETGHNKDLLKCLEVIARIHGRYFNEATVLAGLPLTNGDLTPSTFERAASRLKLASQVLSRSITNLNPSLLPAVILLEDDQACVLHTVDYAKGTAEVVYPDLPGSTIELPLSELASTCNGYVIYCRPEFDFDKRADDAIRTKKKHWFWGVISENRRLYRDVLIAALLINIFALAMPLFVMNVYDRVVPNQATETLWVLAVGVFIAITADMILRLMRTWYVDLAANRIDVKVSANIVHHVLGMKMSDTPQATGSFVSGIQGFESVRQFFSSAAVNALVDLPFVIFFIAVIAIINPYLALPIIIGAVLLFLYALMTQHKMKQLAEDSMKAAAMRNASLVESVSAMPLVKSFNAQSKVQSTWEKSTIFISRTAARMRVLSASLSTSGSWLQQTVAISMIVIGVYLVIAGELTVGGIIAAYLLSSRAMAPIGQAAGLLGQYHNAATAMTSLNELMSKETESDEETSQVSKPILQGGIEFKNVDFAYDEDGPDVLSNLSFVIKPGERVAILGRNGSGKSSVTRLLLGLYHPQKGEVRLDDINVRQLNLTEVRRNIGFLPQEADLFFGTLQDNIMLPTDKFRPERLVEIANQVGLSSVIGQFPDGFNHMIQERGRNLSGGQRQLVALARGLINDPPIVMLDEPTGSLDHNSEDLLRRTLSDTLQGKTLIVVTHKTSMLELVDRIIVIDGGKKVADGNKEDVLQALRSGRVGAG